MSKKYIILTLIFSFIFSAVPFEQARSLTIPLDVYPATDPVVFRIKLDNANARVNSKYAYDNQYQGQNTYVAVIDTGIQSDHPFLKDRVALEACFSASCPNGSAEMIGQGAARPVHWHGTHVAGIIAGKNETSRGIAPQAKIIAINVFDSRGAAYDADIVKALKWIDSISDQYNIAAVNMSLGTAQVFSGTCDTYLPEMTQAILNLKNKNIATVVAAGNNYTYGMNSPACISHSVSVAATYSHIEEVTDFSNLTERTTLSAPGASIYSSGTDSSYRTASGTSMAAPIVAGAYAVYVSKYGTSSVDKITEDYRSTSVAALDRATRISTKRVDFKSLFEVSPPQTTTTTTTVVTTTTSTTTPIITTTTSTTVPVVTTTTLPVSTTTSTTVPISTTSTSSSTTTTVVESDEEDESQLNTPYILLLKKFGPSFMRLNFVYRYTDVPVRNYILECRYTTGTVTSRNIKDFNVEYNRYMISIPTRNLSRCKMAAVSTTGVVGSYTKNVRVR